MYRVAGGLIHKIQIQIEDAIWHKSLRHIMVILLNVVYRRGIPLPAALYAQSTKTGKTEEADLGDENFLAKYMLPQEGKCLIDIGASVGIWTIWAAKQKREVYSFEPSPKAFAALKKESQIYTNIHAYPYALGEKDSVGRLGLSALSLSGSMDVELKGLHQGGTIDIEVRSLDSLNIPNVGIIKIDTEGYETAILRGAKATIQKNRPRLIIEVHRATGKAADTFQEELKIVKTLLQEYGYYWKVHFRPINLHELQPHVIAEPKENLQVIIYDKSKF